MAKEVTPQELAQFCRIVAAGIDAAKNPRADLVASDVRCAIAAMNGDEGAVKRVHSVIAAAKPASAGAVEPAKPISLSFKGELNGDLMQRAAAELEKRRPDLKGKKLQFSLSAKISE